MKTIELTRGKQTIVDDEGYEFLSQWQWVTNLSSGKWYAVRYECGKAILMHRVLMGVADDVETDHRNRDGLDNRRQNLRPSTRTQNQQNRGKWHYGTSQFKGVHRDACGWRAQIHVNKRKITRRFKDELSAALFYDELAAKHFGEFAVLNFT